VLAYRRIKETLTGGFVLIVERASSTALGDASTVRIQVHTVFCTQDARPVLSHSLLTEVRMAIAAQNGTKKERAAMLLAEDDLSDEAIAAELKMGRRTLSNWKLEPEFNALVGYYRGKIVGQALKLHIAKKHKRVARLDDLEQRLWQIVEERASNYAAKAMESEEQGNETRALREIFGNQETVPAGGGTGLITRNLKQIGVGRNAQTIEEFGVATEIVSSIMALHKQAAQELGQWEENQNINHTGEIPVMRIIGISDEELG
jgi:hypothetical protein